VEVRLSPQAGYAVTKTANNNIVTIYRLEHGQTTSNLQQISQPWHPVDVRRAYWLPQTAPDLDSATLVTEAADGMLRIWRCFPDEPNYFVLWLTINPVANGATPLASLWVADAETLKLMSILSDGSVRLFDILVCVSET
jgi:hypothetical protein